MTSYTPEQKRVIRAFRRAIKTTGASRKPAKALYEAGSVESTLRNLNYGDRDSLGPLQQRPSQGWQHARDPYLAAVDFLKQAIPLKGKYGSAGQLAQAVQRSAYPGRYDQRSSEANALLRGSALAAAPTNVSRAASPRSDIGSDTKTQIALSLLGMGNLGGGYGGDSLTNSLVAAAQAKNAPRKVRSASGAASYGQTLPNAAIGSPIAGEKAARADHPTAGLAGYPAHDYMAKAGTPVVAPVSGRVIKLSGHDPKIGPTQGPHGPFGWSAYIKGDDGKVYYLTHLGSRSLKQGQRVRQGQQIGTVGNYAKYGTPSHVHEGVHG